MYIPFTIFEHTVELEQCGCWKYQQKSEYKLLSELHICGSASEDSTNSRSGSIIEFTIEKYPSIMSGRTPFKPLLFKDQLLNEIYLKYLWISKDKIAIRLQEITFTLSFQVVQSLFLNEVLVADETNLNLTLWKK